MRIDETHDPARTSWVESAHGHRDFPIQNLPLGIFSRRRRAPRRASRSATSSSIFRRSPRLLGDAWARGLAAAGAQRLARARRRRPRARCASACPNCCPTSAIATEIEPASDRPMRSDACTCRARSATTPISTPASITRPTSAGSSGPTIRCCPTTNMCRSAITAARSTVRASGEPVVRPSGQRKPPEADAPEFGPCAPARLRTGARHLGRPRQRAWRSRSRSPRRTTQIAGFCLLNDWSARDMQAWEYQPLGPVPGQEFPDHRLALGRHAPRRWRRSRTPSRRGPTAIPRRCPISRCADRASRRLGLSVEVHADRPQRCATPAWRRIACREGAAVEPCTGPPRRSSPTTASNGCNLQPGDLIGTGTMSTGVARRARLAAGDQPGRQGAARRCRPARRAASSKTATSSILTARAEADGYVGSASANAAEWWSDEEGRRSQRGRAAVRDPTRRRRGGLFRLSPDGRQGDVPAYRRPAASRRPGHRLGARQGVARLGAGRRAEGRSGLQLLRQAT